MSSFYDFFGRWFGPYSRWRVKRRGMSDALINIPDWDSRESAPFLKEINSAGLNSVRRYLPKWKKEDGFLKGRFIDTHSRLYHAQKRAREAAEAVDRARSEYREFHNQTSIPIYSRWHNSRYFILLSCLAILEFPVNSIVFQGLKRSAVETWIMALGVGVIIMMVAHSMGRLLRERNKNGAQKAMLSVFACFVLAAVAAVGYMRAIYLQSMVDSAQRLSPRLVGVMFFALNVLLATIGTYASFNHFQKFAKELIDTQKEKLKAQRNLQLAEKNATDARTIREKRHEWYRQRALRILETVRQLEAVYWGANLSKRGADKTRATPYPASYTNPLPFPTPDELLGRLDWPEPPITDNQQSRRASA